MYGTESVAEWGANAVGTGTRNELNHESLYITHIQCIMLTLEQIVSNLFFHLESLLKLLPLDGPELKNIFHFDTPTFEKVKTDSAWDRFETLPKIRVFYRRVTQNLKNWLNRIKPTAHM